MPAHAGDGPRYGLLSRFESATTMELNLERADMTGFRTKADNQRVATMYCIGCGQTMRVAPEHLQMVVACPHCGQEIEPWRHFGLPMPGHGAADCGYHEHRFRDAGSPAHEMPVSARRRITAGLLGVLLGPGGAHRIYLRFPGIGILQILVTIFTLGLGGLWGFIEGILCLTGQGLAHDADGLPLRD